VEDNRDKIATVVQWSNVLMGIRDSWKERKIYEARATSAYEPVAGQKQLPHNERV
jgi:hypothetical protein